MQLLLLGLAVLALSAAQAGADDVTSWNEYITDVTQGTRKLQSREIRGVSDVQRPIWNLGRFVPRSSRNLEPHSIEESIWREYHPSSPELGVNEDGVARSSNPKLVCFLTSLEATCGWDDVDINELQKAAEAVGYMTAIYSAAAGMYGSFFLTSKDGQFYTARHVLDTTKFWDSTNKKFVMELSDDATELKLDSTSYASFERYSWGLGGWWRGSSISAVRVNSELDVAEGLMQEKTKTEYSSFLRPGICEVGEQVITLGHPQSIYGDEEMGNDHGWYIFTITEEQMENLLYRRYLTAIRGEVIQKTGTHLVLRGFSYVGMSGGPVVKASDPTTFCGVHVLRLAPHFQTQAADSSHVWFAECPEGTCEA